MSRRVAPRRLITGHRLDVEGSLSILSAISNFSDPPKPYMISRCGPASRSHLPAVYGTD
jgi:hypothetical protein